MATIVGLNLLVVMAGFIGKLVTEPNSFWWVYKDVFLVIDQVHGLLFMILIAIVTKLGLRQRWSWGYIVGVVLLACVPFVSFWTERRTTKRVHAETTA